jgi:hypothetical protein
MVATADARTVVYGPWDSIARKHGAAPSDVLRQPASAWAAPTSGVSTNSGHTASTRTPRLRSAAPADRAKCTTPALDAAYTGEAGMMYTPPAEAMQTMVPRPPPPGSSLARSAWLSISIPADLQWACCHHAQEGQADLIPLSCLRCSTVSTGLVQSRNLPAPTAACTSSQPYHRFYSHHGLWTLCTSEPHELQLHMSCNAWQALALSGRSLAHWCMSTLPGAWPVHYALPRHLAPAMTAVRSMSSVRCHADSEAGSNRCPASPTPAFSTATSRRP